MDCFHHLNWSRPEQRADYQASVSRFESVSFMQQSSDGSTDDRQGNADRSGRVPGDMETVRLDVRADGTENRHEKTDGHVAPPVSPRHHGQERGYCRSITAVKHDGALYEAHALACRSWLCPACAEKNRKRLIAQAISGKPTIFLTLTVNPKKYSEPEEAASDLTAAWDVLKKRMVRECGRNVSRKTQPFGAPKKGGYRPNADGTYRKRIVLGERKLQYIWVMEKTKAGWPHLHILIRAKWIDQEWLSIQMNNLIGAPIVDVRRIVSNRMVVAYCAKYVGKCAEKFQWTKRYSQSREFADHKERDRLRAEAAQFAWTSYPMRLSTLIKRFQELGANIIEVGEVKASFAMATRWRPTEPHADHG